MHIVHLNLAKPCLPQRCNGSHLPRLHWIYNQASRLDHLSTDPVELD